MVDVAEIKIWGENVGAVRWDENRKLASFQYANEFLEKGWDIAPLKMPLSGAGRIYSFPELRPSRDEPEDTFKGLPGLLADALPDKYGNQLIERWLAESGRPPGSMNPVEKLCFIGSRGMGALEFQPAVYKSGESTFSVELSSLVELASEILSRREQFSTRLDRDRKKAMGQILKIGTSAGGVRPKAVITYNDKTKEIRSGQTKAPPGFEHWLIKLDGVSDAQFGQSHGYGRVEFAYYLMARDSGIQIMDSLLLEENGRAHFMTKRFDREGSNNKHHIQTLCGIQHFNYNHLYAYGYEQIFQTMRILRFSYPEFEQMFRRMVFNVLTVNYDDHTKNFSFRLKQGKEWELAPAYDLCYSYDPQNIWVSQHTMSINGKHRNILQEDLLRIAGSGGIKKADKIIREVSDVVQHWTGYARTAGVSEELTQTIRNSIRKIKL